MSDPTTGEPFVALVFHLDGGQSEDGDQYGPGWWYCDAEYPADLQMGPFATQVEAEQMAQSEEGGGYEKIELRSPAIEEVA